MEHGSAEQIILCDEQGQATGVAEKLASHSSSTPLHRAFSCYVFNSHGKFLVTQRALSKKVWPGFYTNSVCGHPSPGESDKSAIKRRLREELGMTANDVQVLLPDYRYRTPPFNEIIENEFCPVYIARGTSKPKANPQEVESLQWVGWEEFVKAAHHDPNDYSIYAEGLPESLPPDAPRYSWWCKDQIKQLQCHPLILKYSTTS